MGVIYTTKIPRIVAGYDRYAETVIRAGAEDVKARAQQEAPVKTGNLRNSAFAEANGLRAVIGFGANYAIYVHEGARGRAPRPFLYSAMKSVAPSIIRRLSDVSGL